MAEEEQPHRIVTKWLKMAPAKTRYSNRSLSTPKTWIEVLRSLSRFKALLLASPTLGAGIRVAFQVIRIL
jgi:hypothetical protein